MPFDIILFAAIAIFFFWKLRQQLGHKTGEERERDNPFAAPHDKPADAARDIHNTGPDTVIAGESRELPVAPDGRPPFGMSHPEASVAGGLMQLRSIDHAFDEKAFITGARQAYTLIAEAFASGDKPTLKMLLTPAVYDSFVTELDARAARGEVLVTQIKRMLVSEIAAARTEGNRGIVTVDFTSEQISVTRNQTGEVIDGDAVQPVEVAEAWIFERDLTSRDPAWYLVATKPF